MNLSLEFKVKYFAGYTRWWGRGKAVVEQWPPVAAGNQRNCKGFFRRAGRQNQKSSEVSASQIPTTRPF